MKLKFSKKWLAWLVPLVAFCVLALFMWQRITFLLDSDMSSEMVLANLLAREGRWVWTPNWYYSTELRVLNAQIIWGLLFRFTGNWHLVRVAGSALLYLILVAAYYFFCRRAGINFVPAVLSCAVLLLPFCADYFDFVLIGVYYTAHLAISFAVLGLLLHFAGHIPTANAVSKPGSPLRNFLVAYWPILIAALLSFAAGLGGLRQLLVLYIPATLAAFLLLLLIKPAGLKTWRDTMKNEPSRFLVGVLAADIGAVVGYLVQSCILSRSFSFYYPGSNFTAFSVSRLEELINFWLQAFGYCPEGSLFSVALVPNALCFLIIALLILALRSAIHGDGIFSFPQRAAVLFFGCGAFVISGLYLFSDTGLQARYLLPISIFALPAIVLYLQTLRRPLRLLLALGMSVAVLVSSWSCYHTKGQVDRTSEMRDIAALLCQSGFTEGYSTFWEGNVLTELSNGQLDMRVWMDSSDGIEKLNGVDHTYQWLQKVSHSTTRPQKDLFLLLFPWEKDAWPAASSGLTHEHLFAKTENYEIYAYDAYDDLPAALQGD